ncbi:MAG: hypothetical protein WC379_16120 [Methanoregula sp.]|jgi:hypothetical protein
MSHQLHFFTKNKSGGILSSVRNILGQPAGSGKNNDDELLRFFGQYLFFNKPDITPDGFDIGYLNPDTGSQFFFNLHRSDIPEFEKEHRFPGYSFNGLVFTVNYNRPLTFMTEALSIIMKLAKTFDLFILDDGDPSPNPVPKPFDATMLILDYAHSNVVSTNNMLKGHSRDTKFLVGPDPSAYLPSEKAQDWWTYMNRKRAIATIFERDGVDLFVPELWVFRKKGVETLFTVMAFGEDVPYLLPPCDLFYVQRKKDLSECGMVPASEMMRVLEPYLGEATVFDMKFRVLPVKDAERFAETLQTIPLDTDLEEYTRLAQGNFLDFKPEFGDPAK